jgi:alpha-D-ribose 1-methylphosphonate 5-phosphate C-P lyase
VVFFIVTAVKTSNLTLSTVCGTGHAITRLQNSESNVTVWDVPRGEPEKLEMPSNAYVLVLLQNGAPPELSA